MRVSGRCSTRGKTDSTDRDLASLALWQSFSSLPAGRPLPLSLAHQPLPLSLTHQPLPLPPLIADNRSCSVESVGTILSHFDPNTLAPASRLSTPTAIPRHPPLPATCYGLYKVRLTYLFHFISFSCVDPVPSAENTNSSNCARFPFYRPPTPQNASGEMSVDGV